MKVCCTMFSFVSFVCTEMVPKNSFIKEPRSKPTFPQLISHFIFWIFYIYIFNAINIEILVIVVDIMIIIILLTFINIYTTNNYLLGDNALVEPSECKDNHYIKRCSGHGMHSCYPSNRGLQLNSLSI